MTAAARLFDGSGLPTLDISDRITRLIGMFYINGPGSISDGNFASGAVFYIFTPIVGESAGPIFSLSGNTLSWSIDPSDFQPGYLIYGLY